ncbi:hypothetical protein JA1_002860 [Spathaspora sp. JA1]|nr:hypothetical protein JA1_002860 [Spathaspora sp. JA1]
MLNYNYSLNQAQSKTSFTSTSTPSQTPTITTTSPNSLSGPFINSNSPRLHRRSNSVDFTNKTSAASMNSNYTPPSSPTSMTRSSNATIGRKRSIIIDLDKVTEEYKNCERRLSVASVKQQPKRGEEDDEVDTDAEFYMRELELSCQLPLSSELLLQSYCRDEDKNEQSSEDENFVGRRKSKRSILKSLKLKRNNSIRS